MSELGIYEGCYVQLRNGDVVGPIKDRGDAHAGARWATVNPHRVWYHNGLWSVSTKTDLDIVQVIDQVNAVNVPVSDDVDAPMLGKPAIPPHVTKAAMDAGIKADPAYEQFVNAILTAGFKAQYEIGFVPVGEKDAAIEELEDRIDGLNSDLQSAVEVAFNRGAEDWVRMNYPAQFARLMAAKAGNESDNRFPDSAEPKGGLSDLRNEIVRILRDNDTIRGIGATADAIMKIVEGFQVGTPAIPSLREIHDEVLAEVRDWHAKYGRDSMPSTFSIAKAFHRMLRPTVVEKPSNPFDALETMEYKSTKE